MKRFFTLVLVVSMALFATIALAELNIKLNQTVELPVTDTPVTYTMMMGSMATFEGAGMETEADSLAYQEFFRRTGVTLDIFSPGVGSMVENYNIMLASGDYPDVVSVGSEFSGDAVYKGGLDKAFDDGVYIRLNELVEEHMPNYWAIINSSEEFRRNAFTDGGNLRGICTVFDPVQYNWYGPVVRQDWLNDLGLDTPVTYDDWYEMLTLFKTEKGAVAPLVLPKSGIVTASLAGSHLANGFDTCDTFLLDENGNVTYGPITEGFRKYIETMAQWYSEGLIDPDFYSGSSFLPDTNLTNTGKAGVWMDMYTIIGNHKLQSDDPNIHVVPLPDPVEKEGDLIHVWRTGGSVGGPYWLISTACEDPIPLLKALDYLYTEEGRLLADFGFEGETFEIVDGKPQYTELVYANPDGMPVNSAMVYYQMQEAPKLYNYTKEMIGLPDEAYSAPAVWQSNCAETTRLLPAAVSLNTQEGERSAAIMSDITTYVSENVVNFINGNRPISEYDNFVAQIYSMGIEEAIGLRQGAYNRYLAR